ncbi:MAG: LON peptidase substrate-binding domain-containing protein [Verrucomicrobiae bacterium]|nr:LON peptidase substrate-binding domain-containing protein [Verrucomicrobiae bacterium]
MTLPGVILFPEAMLPLYIFEPRYRRMLADALQTHRMITVAMRRPNAKYETPARVAGLGLIRAAVTSRDGTSRVMLQGIGRVELLRAIQYRPYRVYAIRPMQTHQSPTPATYALASRVAELVQERIELGFDLPIDGLQQILDKLRIPAIDPDPQVAGAWFFQQAVRSLVEQDDPEQLADLVSATLVGEPAKQQTILETRNIDQRLRCLVQFLLEDIRKRRSRKKND